jgi:ribosomal protein L11 methyltransferase
VRLSEDQPIWPTVRLLVPAADVDYASGELWEFGATGIAEEDPDAEGNVELIAGFASVALAESAARRLDHTWSPRAVVVEGSEWMDTWRDHFEPFTTDTFVVMPAWRPDAELPLGGATRIRLDLDPGRAFGSGAHPSTRLILDLLPDALLSHSDAAVLDVGCGSGILSVAALALGASSVVAVDVDTDAVRVTRENAARNGVEDRLAVSHDSAHLVAGQFDIVLANILAPVLRELAPVLSARTKPDGALLLSGLIDTQVDDVVACFPGFRVVERLDTDPWVALVLRR